MKYLENIKRLYYLIWVDFIIWERKRNGKHRDWKFTTLVFISTFQSLNILAIMMILSVFFNFNYFPFHTFDFFQGDILDNVLSFAINLFIPFAIINYLLVFRKGKYLHLVKRYDYKGGKYIIAYMIITFLLFWVPLIVYIAQGNFEW